MSSVYHATRCVFIMVSAFYGIVYQTWLCTIVKVLLKCEFISKLERYGVHLKISSPPCLTSSMFLFFSVCELKRQIHNHTWAHCQDCGESHSPK